MLIAKLWHFLVLLYRPLLCWLVVIFPAFGAVDDKALESDDKALEILGKTSAYYQGLANFSAVYSLKIKYPDEDTVREDKMEITAQGQQYKLSYDQKETITDGETVWVYDKALKEVTISEYAKTDSDLNFAELYNLYLQGYQSVYIEERIIHKANNKTKNKTKNKAKNIILDIVQLTPLDPDSSFKKIILHVDRATWQIHGWEVVQNEETRYICTVCSFAFNIKLSDAYFSFDIGAHGDLEVIDLRESEEEQAEEAVDLEEG